MILVWILTGFLIALLTITLVLLFIPFWLEINTLNNIYEIRAGWVFTIGITLPQDGRAGVYVNILGIRKQLQPGHKEAKQAKVKRGKKAGKKFKMPEDAARRIAAVLHSFKIKQFFIDIDTGDFIINAWLFPAFHILKQIRGTNANINFTGQREAVILVQNSAFRIIKAFITKK